ncbi:MAG: sigma-70 family RNA polymerase sigma factor [Firmicutes bacterium]|nr:sigma-70 family RNA polymerase sigma factor [Bacillota bacterium]
MVIDTRVKSRFINSDMLNRYYCEISSYPVLTVDEEVELFTSYKNGNKKSRTRIIECNQRFVVSVAKKFAKSDIELLDMISEGNIGLIKAIDMFDVTRGFKFISYAVHWIYAYISRYMDKNPMVYKRVDFQLNKQVKEIKKLLMEDGLDESNELIISILKEKYDTDVEEKDLYNIFSVSIDIPEDDTNYMSGISDFERKYSSQNEILNVIDDNYNKYLIAKHIKDLKSMEQKVIKLYFGIDYEYDIPNFVRIGEKLNISPQLAGVYYRRGLRKMRKSFQRSNEMIRKF